jgi:hypothetical protein
MKLSGALNMAILYEMIIILLLFPLILWKEEYYFSSSYLSKNVIK